MLPRESDSGELGQRWSLVMDPDGTLRANRITPTWGGGGLVVMPVSECASENEGGYRLSLTREEVEALLGACGMAAFGFSFGPTPGQGPGVTAQAKLEALVRPR